MQKSIKVITSTVICVLIAFVAIIAAVPTGTVANGADLLKPDNGINVKIYEMLGREPVYVDYLYGLDDSSDFNDLGRYLCAA